MKKYIFLLSMVITAVSCREEVDANDTILAGKLELLVDENLTPLIEEQVAVFESDYPATVNVMSMSENELIMKLVQDSSRVAIMARNLTAEELRIFDKRKIIPKVTPFGRDAVVFLRNAGNRDSLLPMSEMVKFMKGSPSLVKGIVLDNPNSGTLRRLLEVAEVSQPPSANVFSFNTTAEAMAYVAENDGMIGVVALNHITQPTPKMEEVLKKTKVLSVQAIGGGPYVYPSQDALASETYPLARDLFIVNCQGYAGLGVGFGSFIAGQRGQRIMLKAGLLPIRIPGRNIIIRKNIEKKTEN